MITFWILASVMILVAVALLIVPLMRKRPEKAIAGMSASVAVHRHRATELENEHARGMVSAESLERARSELKRELLDDTDTDEPVLVTSTGATKAIFATAVLVPLIAFGLYLWSGSAGVVVEAVEASKDSQSSGQVARQEEMHGVSEMIGRLERKLEQSPGDAEGWILLGRSYAYLKRFDAASRAFAVAVDLKPDDPRLLGDYAEALAVTRNSRIDMEVMGLVQRALAIDPDTGKALWLSGLERYQEGDRAQALAIWKRLRQQMPANSKDGQTLDAYIAQVSSEVKKTDVARAEPLEIEPGAAPTNAAASAITVHVALDPALARRASDDDTVFVFARAHEGPAMPLAIVRKQVRDLPLQVTLDDTQSMAPGMSISKFPSVVVAARISKHGDARPQAGDLQGLSQPLQTGTSRIAQVRIDQVVQ